MRRLTPQDDWPASWRLCFEYDRLEIYGSLERRGYTYAYSLRREQTLRLVRQAGLTPGAKVLDVAAAQGNFSLALAELGYEVTWNDLRQELAGYVSLKDETGALRFAPGNAFELQFPGRFDLVLATEVIEHVAHPDEFLRQLRELARPGGCIVLTTPNGGYFRNRLPSFSEIGDTMTLETRQFRPDADGHLFLLHARELRDLARAAGLVVEELVLFCNSLTNGHMKLEAALRRLPRNLVETIERATQRMPHLFASRLLTQLGARLRVPGG